MAKSFKATWLGDGDPTAQLITEAGLRFIKGEPATVPADHTFNGIDWADKIRSNPAFSVDDAEEPVDGGEEAEIEAVKEVLDAKGIKYHPNSRLDTLRAKLAE